MVPDVRIRHLNSHAPRPGAYVLYWMIAARRARSSFALDRALEQARALGVGLVVFEPLRVAYPWASVRLHRFVLDGMEDNQRAFDRPGVTYLPYLEPEPDAGAGLLAALTASAAVVVTDEFPCGFLPRMVTAAAARVPMAMEAVDGNGLIPLRATDHAFPTAYAFRRQVQTSLRA
ncbi:MAG: deoxyribodipyrimidine photolyase, partial [Acidobacteriota bacterium]